MTNIQAMLVNMTIISTDRYFASDNRRSPAAPVRGAHPGKQALF